MLVQDPSHNYYCPENPANFSWFYSSRSDPNSVRSSLKSEKWTNRSIVFVGGSTSRQMAEQLKWEMPEAANTSARILISKFLFWHIKADGIETSYTRSHELDLRSLDLALIDHLKAAPDFVVFNVGTWWSTTAIGHVIDENGLRWQIGGLKTEESKIMNDTASHPQPNLKFAHLMESAIKMMLAVKSPNTTLVWRSESTTDCPPGQTYRGTISPVLKRLQVPVLNISEATCNYVNIREGYDKEHKGPHLCFPSVALRHWLLEFQEQFL